MDADATSTARVLALEKAAQEQWQAQEEQLQQKLMETQQRLNELQAAKSDDQQLVLSAEQKAELEKFRQQRFETQRQLKDVRKNLRHSIESLGLRLKVINLMAVPLVVAVFGVVLGWRRSVGVGCGHQRRESPDRSPGRSRWQGASGAG